MPPEPDSWSWTRLSILDNCELSHDLQYNKKVKGKSGSQEIYLTGRVIHKVIHEWTKLGYPDDSAIEQLIRTELGQELALLGHIDKAKAMTYTNRVVLGTFAAAKLYRKLELKEHGAIIEERFSLSVPGFGRLNGAPDAYDPVTRSIVDLKTQRTGRGKKDQLLNYSWSEQLLGREVVEGIFVYPLQKVQIERYPISLADIEDWASRAKVIAEKKDGTLATEGNHCYFCPFNETRNCPVTWKKGHM